MKVSGYNSMSQMEQAKLAQKAKEAVKEQANTDDLNKPAGETTTPEADKEEPTQETILEGIQRVKEEMNSVRYNRELTDEVKTQQLRPLQQELDELVNSMQLAIKSFANQKTNELFGFNANQSNKVGTLFDFLA
ncbi:hypothetical protein [Motilimonas sp. KMU-193]|uniref:hypothetical protein n=1 Tax=Motilimonas sp. KMU-193 TaxID=3388668 RepID=UPI00396AF116